MFVAFGNEGNVLPGGTNEGNAFGKREEEKSNKGKKHKKADHSSSDPLKKRVFTAFS